MKDARNVEVTKVLKNALWREEEKVRKAQAEIFKLRLDLLELGVELPDQGAEMPDGK
jgi:hypothetical protein